MASGTIYGTTSNEYIISKIEWSSQVIEGTFTSSVTANLYYKRTNSGYTTQGTGTFSVTIGSKTNSNTRSMRITESGWTSAGYCVTSVDHSKTTGKATVTISASGYIPDTTLTSTSCSETVTLDTIAVASNITSASNTTLGNACSIRWTPHSASLRYKVGFSLGGWSHTTDFISPATTSAYTYTGYTIPLDVANKISANSKTGTMQAILSTYSGSTLIGQTSKTFTVTIPDNEYTKPTVSMEVSPFSDLSSPYNSLYIQGLSRVKATVSSTTKYGATVSASSITVNGKTYNSPYETDILSQDGKVSVKATVKDSRGFYGTYYKEIDVIPYSQPYIRAKSGESEIIAARCDSSATFTDSGTYLKIKAKAVYSKVQNNNHGFIKFRYRKEGGSYSAWQTILDCEANNSDEVITPPLLNGNLDIKSNYQVQVIASDDFYDSVPITIAVPSDAVYMDRPAGGKSMGLGGYSSGDGNLDIHWKTKARGGVSLFDAKGDEIPLDSTMPLPRDQVSADWNPDNLECGIYAVTNTKPLKQGTTVIMYNGVLIQMIANVGGNVKIQLALTSDETRNPYYRVCWYGNWGNWRSFKL